MPSELIFALVFSVAGPCLARQRNWRGRDARARSDDFAMDGIKIERSSGEQDRDRPH